MDKNKLSEYLNRLVRNLRKGKIMEATELIPRVTEDIRGLLLAQKGEELKKAAFIIHGIVNSFQKNDYVLMADLIEYEILPLLKRGGIGT